jgi:hypothetical protein
MGIAEILVSIDNQIAQLERARALLSGSKGAVRGNGRSSGSAAGSGAPAKPAKRKKRKLSPEGRRRIVEAAKRRWETQRKSEAVAQK